MKLFRFRFIILGLLLCIFHVWCRTCGTVFTDPASSTYLAQIVIEGTVSQKLPYGDLYSLRVYVKKVRKGDQYLPQGKKTRTLIIGDFSDTVNQELCITNITADKQQKYFFFIKNTTRGYVNTALPIESNKKTARDVRKLACRTCDKAPVLKTIKVKPIIEGKKIQISCRLRIARPAPILVWEKDGQILENGKKGFQTKTTKRGIVLRKKKASLSDSGTYVCEAKNVVGKTRQEVLIKVRPDVKTTKKPQRKTTPPLKNEVTTSIPELFYECPKEHDGRCFNGGTCEIIADLGVPRCRCPATHQGKRCEYRKVILNRSMSSDSEALKKDRTLTIIGIVIGVLVFICICIGSYVLANSRRKKFFDRQAKERQQNEKNKSIPQSYSKLPSVDEVSEISKSKPFNINMNNRATQTDETGFLAPNPHTNMNLHINPWETDLLRYPDLRRNSRSRLSAVSDNKRSQQDTLGNHSSPIIFNGVDADDRIEHSKHLGSENVNTEIQNEKDIPRIPKFSEADASSDEEKTCRPPSLYISEQEQSPHLRKYNGMCEDSLDSSVDSSPERENSSANTHSTLIYPPPDTSKDLSSSVNSLSSNGEQLTKSNEVVNFDLNSHNGSSISWNERGSPEVVRKPRRRGSSDMRKSSITNQNEMYSHLATSGAVNIYGLRDEDTPSIPV